MLKLHPGSKETKVAAYKALVRPQLEYAAPILNPCHQTEIDRTETVQRSHCLQNMKRVAIHTFLV